MIQKLEHPSKAEKLFGGWQEGCIWSALQGIMGEIYVDDGDSPSCGAVVLGDFTFLAGTPSRELVLWSSQDNGKESREQAPWNSPDDRKGIRILVPENADWDRVIEEVCGDRAKKVIRYAIKKERDIFDREKLEKAASGLPEGYAAAMIDEELFHRCMSTEWCRDGVANYPDYDLYRQHGLGVVILKEKEIVASCSSYCGFRDGIEIEIDTRMDERRKGLACACAARLILECLDRGWFPSWDAQNLMSMGLAKKLGYHFDQEYTSYEVSIV